MNRTSRLCSVAAALACALGASSARAGAEVDFGDGSIAIDYGIVRAVFDDGEKTVILLDSNNKRLTVYMEKDEVYTTGTLSELCRATKRLLEMAKAQNEAAMGAPEEGFVAYDGGSRSVTFRTYDSLEDAEVVPGEGRRQLAGYAVENYDALIDGELYASFSITRSKKIRKYTEAVDWNALRRFNKCGFGYATLLNGRFSDTHLEDGPEWVKLFRKGLLVRMERPHEGERDVARKIEVKEHPRSYFEVPSGYQEIPFKEAIKQLAQELTD